MASPISRTLLALTVISMAIPVTSGQDACTGDGECTSPALCCFATGSGLCVDPTSIPGQECGSCETTACNDNRLICCPTRKICDLEVANTGACGDPHMTGFRGQKFDFTGEDGEWYCVLQDGQDLQLNMRVTSPVPSLPEITYITGLSVRTTDTDGEEHAIIIQVTDPYTMDSSCPKDVSPCLADGSLTVEIDGERVLLAPGTLSVGPEVEISAVNLPGSCRTFGFEKYWERKSLEVAQAGRKLDLVSRMQDMGDWILGDPTVTNAAECTEYVTRAIAGDDRGLFAHESEHALFQILTPSGPIRLSHGRLHQLPMRDPTDRFDLPDHQTWQMNLAIDHNNVRRDAAGILGETIVPTIDITGNPIMSGMKAIRGDQDAYRVGGPLGTIFDQGQHHN